MANTPTQVIDYEALGRLLRAMRTIAGYDRAEDAAQALTDRGGSAITGRMVTALERGDNQLSLAMAVLMVNVFQPPGGFRFLEPALDPAFLPLCPI